MFSPDITESDAFLEMPASAHSLYFHLGMYADDDGFVNPRKIMRMLGSSEDDLKVLLAKRFLLTFASGVVVVKHWKINNLVRKDWYRPTQYVEEKKLLLVKENGAYTDDLEQYPHLVNEPLTQVRLGKVSISSASEDGQRDDNSLIPSKEETAGSKFPPAKYPHALEVFSWFPNPQESWKSGRSVQEREYAEFLYKRGEETVKKALRYCEAHKEDDMFYKITKPSDLEKKWEDIRAYAKRNS